MTNTSRQRRARLKQQKAMRRAALSSRLPTEADARAKRQVRMYTVTGVLHLVAPGVFVPLIPKALPGARRQWAVWSGVAELGVAGLLAVPRTRRLGGAASAALLIGVWPGNLKMALDWRDKPWPMQAVAIGRLPLQITLIRAAGVIARG